jgi:hypothetical protein
MHGAALGNVIFLPLGAVYIDVVPENNEDKHAWAFFMLKDFESLEVGAGREEGSSAAGQRAWRCRTAALANAPPLTADQPLPGALPWPAESTVRPLKDRTKSPASDCALQSRL